MQQINAQQIHFVNAIIFDNAAHVRAVEGEAGAITFDFEDYKTVRGYFDAYKFVMSDRIQLSRGKYARGLLTERQIDYLGGFCCARFNGKHGGFVVRRNPHFLIK